LRINLLRIEGKPERWEGLYWPAIPHKETYLDAWYDWIRQNV
ncbi:hypothetical protein LCGC14_2491730, partial [marine sediment metagenome]